MQLLLCTSEAQAQLLSRGLYRLSRPQELSQAAGDVTRFALSWRRHPSDEAWALEIPAGQELPRHPAVVEELAADPSEAAALMGTAVVDQAGLLAYVLAHARLSVPYLLSFCDPARVLDEAAATTAGWFGEAAP